MTQADSVHSTPPTNTSSESATERPAPAASELYYPTDVSPEEAFQAIGRLRKAARDEINRLIRFLDETDNHMELEINGDEADASYPEGCLRLSDHPNEDDEPSGDENEPSLGSICASENRSQQDWSQGNDSDREDEHDGAEPDGECDGKPDDEPSLGWPEANGIGGAGCGSSDDREAQDYNSVQPQNRTVIDRKPITVECSYRKFVSGLTDSQRASIKSRMDRDSGVVLR